MRKVALILLLLTFVSGCCPGMVRVEAIDGTVDSITERHDAYVEADTTLTDEQKEVYLRSTELLQKLLKEAAD